MLFRSYFQGVLSVTNDLDIHAGVRHSKVIERFKSHNDITSALVNGALNFEGTTPVTGIIWKILPTINIYANYGQGFETPTLIETAYNSATSSTGPNTNLKSSFSDNYEVGLKAFITNTTRTWGKGEVSFGFNLSRVFTVKK